MILKNNKGMSAVEFVVATVIVSLIVVVLYDVLRETTNAYRYQDVQTNSVQQSRNAMEKMVREIRQADISTIVITTLDANRDRIVFNAPLELENPDDMQTVKYEPQVNGDLQRTVTYQAGGSDMNIVATGITKLYFNPEYEGEIAIRMTMVNSNQTIKMATKIFPRNKPQNQ
jgi:Tfp pilus assembly protein PilW